MTTSIDEELDEAGRGIGLVYNGVDDTALSFVPMPGAAVADVSETLGALIDCLSQRGILDRLPPEINAVRIDGV